MELFKMSEDLSSQDLEPFLTSISRDEELPVLRNEFVDYDSQEVINEQLKFEESFKAENRSTELCLLNESSPTGHNPSTVNFPGHYLFSAEPDNARTDKAWLYSDILEKVFIDVNKVLIIRFRVNSFVPGLFVRALPVYSSCDFSQEPVLRCPNHSKKDDPDFKAHTEDDMCLCSQFNLAGHVLRAHSHTSLYHYDMSSKRHSVFIPMPTPQAGDSYVTIPFSFACKTSCASGMQRRPIIIVFTLENEFCQVMGRQVVGVKICACPKRDIERMERDYYASFDCENIPLSNKDPDNMSQKKSETGRKRAVKRFDMDSQSLKMSSLSKKIKLVPVVQSSGTDNSDCETDSSVKKDLEAAVHIIKHQIEPVMNQLKSLEPALQQIRILTEKLTRMYKKICRKLRPV